jgi:hypothetical protein
MILKSNPLRGQNVRQLPHILDGVFCLIMESNEKGWIKLHRKFTSWGWYSDVNTKVVFLHLLLTANTDDGEFLGVKIKRGQVVIGRNKLSAEIGLSERQTRTALEHLKNTHEIDQQTTNKYTIVTICKYDTYQSRTDSKRPTNDQQTTSKRPQLKKNSNIITNITNIDSIARDMRNGEILKIRGELKNILLTDSECKVIDDMMAALHLNGNHNDMIDFVASYKATKDKVYKNDYAAIKNWGYSGFAERQKRDEKSATKKSLEERQKDFYESLVPYIDKYDRQMIRDFYNYWSQVNEGGTKMLWEMQKAFEISKRLATWSSRRKSSSQTQESLYRNAPHDKWEQAKKEKWI